MVAAAITAAGAVASVAGNLAGGSAQAAGAQQAAQTLQPYNQAGLNVLPQLNNLLTGNPQAALAQLPGYQFSLNQGLKSAQNGFAARGLGSSGAAMKGAAQYATGLADQTYGNQVDRLTRMYSIGENAAAGVGNAYQNAGTALGSGLAGAGNAFASGANNAASMQYGNQLMGQFNNIGTGANNYALSLQNNTPNAATLATPD